MVTQMKRFFSIFLLALMPAVLFASVTNSQDAAKLPPLPIEGAKWKQTFGDEFDGSTIDPNNWNIKHIDRTCRKNNFWHRDCAALDGKEAFKPKKMPEETNEYSEDILERVDAVNGTGPFKPNLESLKNNFEYPDWFMDAKFGLWIHWGAQSVPEIGGGWYARHMYMENVGKQAWGKDAFEYHRRTFGHQSEFGYKDVCNAWKAKKYDADAIVSFFKDCGARYVSVTAVHHDNFDNFDSAYQPWNSVNIGPKRDIVGEFAQAARKHKLPLCITSHTARSWEWMINAFRSDNTGPKKGVPYDGNLTKADGEGTWWQGYDPADLYGPPPGKRTPELRQAYELKWKRRMADLIEKYRPDMLYFDGRLPLQQHGLDIAAYLYNSSLKWNNGKGQSVLSIKSGPIVKAHACVRDFEKGGSDRLEKYPWQTDTTMFAGWFYKADGKQFHNAETIIEALADNVSKNGNLLLNVEIYPDGSMPDNRREVLEKVGAWLKLNGEAIYNTRPWKVFGEGTTKTASGHMKERTIESEPYTAKDIRFTTADRAIYAIVLDWPRNELVITSFAGKKANFAETIKEVNLIGSDKSLIWELKEDGLHIMPPAIKPCKYAFAFKVSY